MATILINLSDVKFTIISSENGKEHIGHVTRRLAHVNDKIDMKLVDQSIHGKAYIYICICLIFK